MGEWGAIALEVAIVLLFLSLPQTDSQTPLLRGARCSDRSVHLHPFVIGTSYLSVNFLMFWIKKLACSSMFSK
jgi:hypothetical protein